MHRRILVALSLLALPCAARAQSRPDVARYVYFGLSAEFERSGTPEVSPGPFDNTSMSGVGLGGEVGVSLLSWLDLFAGVDVARVGVTPRNLSPFSSTTSGFSENAQLRHVEGGARFRLPLTARFSPFLEAGYSRRRMHYGSSYERTYTLGTSYSTTGEPAFETEEKGIAPLVGLGFETVLSPAFTLDVTARSTAGKFDERTLVLDGVHYPDYREPPSARATRVRVAARWYPAITGVRR